MVSWLICTDYDCLVGSIVSIIGAFDVARTSNCALISTNTSSCCDMVYSTVFRYSVVALNEVVLWSVYACVFYSSLYMWSYLCEVSTTYYIIFLFYVVISLCMSVVCSQLS